MTAINATLEIEQGATFSFAFTLNDRTPGDDGDGTPRDLTGCSARMQIRKRQGKAIQLSAVSPDHILLGDGQSPTNGRVRILLPAALTDQLATKTSVFDLELVRSDGVTVDRILAGAVEVAPNITQSGSDNEKVLR